MRGGRQHGITLVEVLVAMTVMAIGMIAVLALLSQAIAIRTAELQRMRLARLATDAGELAAMSHASNAPAELAAWSHRVGSALPAVTAVAEVTERDGIAVAEVRLAWHDNRGRSLELQRDYPLAAAP